MTPPGSTARLEKPARLPTRPEFSSGPCAKRPGWTTSALDAAQFGRSHRSQEGKARIAEVIDRSKALLGIPADYRLAVVPASDTGAIEMAMWSLLGPRGVDVLAWETFGKGWLGDVQNQLRIQDARALTADYGELPDLGEVDFGHDVIFTWNGTTSGVRVPNADWIPDDREGLVLCDATSAVFAMQVEFAKLDVVTWSWQKVLGGEAAHGMLALSPRAVERLESYAPPRPLPKIFRMTKKGKLDEALFEGSTINTPSMLCVEDAIDGLRWAEAQGGLPSLIERSQRNLASVESWLADSGGEWAKFLASDPAVRSSTSICLALADASLAPDEAAKATRALATLLDREGAAFDVGAHRDAPAGLRLWGGATVETADLEALFPWLDWAWQQVR
ncbi:MAG: phosphoserine transaminase [Myxococcota bacterium]|nr:phosphoserine transaminase [Myxococcota bacterium]